MATCHQKRCPECKRKFSYASAQQHPWLPFCSERCKVVDLGRWFNGEYAVVEDLNRGHDLKDKIDFDDPDVQDALDQL
jgi:endogenous inhibitor of DNA gyrase (YacG/DUF329 family)